MKLWKLVSPISLPCGNKRFIFAEGNSHSLHDVTWHRKCNAKTIVSRFNKSQNAMSVISCASWCPEEHKNFSPSKSHIFNVRNCRTITCAGLRVVFNNCSNHSIYSLWCQPIMSINVRWGQLILFYIYCLCTLDKLRYFEDICILHLSFIHLANYHSNCTAQVTLWISQQPNTQYRLCEDAKYYLCYYC